MQLKHIQTALRATAPSEVNQILKLFGHWPVPSPEFEVPNDCLAAIWLSDYIACMGILDQAMRSVLLEQLQPRITGWGPEGPQPSETDDCCIRIADRRFFFSLTTYTDLSTGKIFTGLPKLPPVERLILDIHSIFRRRQREAPDATSATQNGG